MKKLVLMSFFCLFNCLVVTGNAIALDASWFYNLNTSSSYFNARLVCPATATAGSPLSVTLRFNNSECVPEYINTIYMAKVNGAIVSLSGNANGASASGAVDHTTWGPFYRSFPLIDMTTVKCGNPAPVYNQVTIRAVDSVPASLVNTVAAVEVMPMSSSYPVDIIANSCGIRVVGP